MKKRRNKVDRTKLAQVLSETLTQHPPTSKQSIIEAFREVVVEGPLKGTGLLSSQWEEIYTPGQSPGKMAEQIIQEINAKHKLTIPRGVSGKGMGKKNVTDGKEKYRKKSYTPKPGKSPIEMKMSEHNRLMATERSQEYIEDREKLLELFMREIKGSVSKKAKVLHENLRRKWDIPSLVLRGDGVGKLHFKMYERGAIDLVAEDEWASIHHRADNNYGNRPLAGIPYRVTADGKYSYVQLRIDLSQNRMELVEAFDKMIKAWKQEHEKTLRKTEYDPWEIYDMVHNDRPLNLLQIARKLYGKKLPRKKRRPADNKKLWPPYKRVKRAYDQAVKMIKAVEEDAHRRETELGL